MKTRRLLPKAIPSGWLPTVLLILAGWSAIILFGMENPFKVFYYLIQGVIGDVENFYSTLNKLFIFILTALAFSIPAWTGMWNIGGEGQLLLGGFGAAWLALYFKTDISIVNITVTLLFSIIIGGLWALWPALLRIYLDVNEVVTTLMSNYLVSFFTTYLVSFPYRAAGSTWPRMQYVPDNFQIGTFAGTELSLMFFISVIILAIVEIVRRYFIIGYEFRMVGNNKVFAEQGGIKADKIRMLAMFIGGALAGLAGGMLVLGLNSTFTAGFSPGYGFVGLLIALISGNMPVIILGVAFTFSALQIGAISMQMFTRIPAEITGVLQSVLVFFIAARKSLKFKVKSGGMEE